jgi:surfactin synthase thioesterase subunit
MTSRTTSYVPIAAGADRSVVCFPWTGAGALPFRTWKKATPPGVSLCAARLGAREDRLREAAPTDWPDVVAALTDDLDVVEPFVLFGHCLGALMAFEVGRELRRRNRPLPARLVVVGDAPVRSGVALPVDEALAVMRRSGAINERILDDPDVFPIFEPAIRADLQLAGNYEYTAEPPLPIPIDLIVASAGDEAGDDTVAREWAAESAAAFRVVPIEGTSLLPHGSWKSLADTVLATDDHLTTEDRAG